jgi:hypothetical protein
MLWWLSHLSFPWWIYAVALVCFVAQLVALARAFLEWRRRPWLAGTQTSSLTLRPTIGLLALSLGVPAAGLAFIEPGRKALVASGVLPPDPVNFNLEPSAWDRYRLLAYFPGWAAATAILTGLAFTFTLATRWKTLTARTRVDAAQPGDGSCGLFTPSTFEVGVVVFSFFACAVVPFLLSLWEFDQHNQNTFALATSTPPGEQERIILGGFPKAAHVLNVGVFVGAFGLLLAIAIALFFLRRWQKQGMAWPQPDRSVRRALPGCALLLASAGVLAALATPFRLENRMPWPALAQGGTTRVWPALDADTVARNPLNSPFQIYNHHSGENEALPFPVLVGTEDASHLTPSLHLAPGNMHVNWIHMGEADVREELIYAMRSHPLLHPEDDRQDRLVLLSTPEMPGSAVAHWLEVAYDVGYQEVLLASGRLETIRRPSFGALSRVHLMTTPAWLSSSVDNIGAGRIVRLPCGNFDHFQDLLTATIKETRAGKKVVLALPAK